jgi:hypothetical protein
MEWILLFIGLGIVAAIISNRPKKNSASSILKQNQDRLFQQINNLNTEDRKDFVARDFSGAMIYDEVNRKLHIVNSKFKNADKIHTFETNSYNLNEIMESEVLINQNSISKVNKSQLLGSVAAGGLIFGGFGAIVGALTADKSNIEYVKEVNLKIKTEDVDNPIHTVNFLRNEDLYTMDIIKQGFHKDSSEVRAALMNVEKWQGIMETLIRKQNKSNLA